MASRNYNDYGIFTILSNQPSLRESERYQKVRNEINGRLGFISGSVKWDSVFEECVSLGTDIGFDFLFTSYFSVAAFKVQGVKGFANGLELMASAYVEDIEHRALSKHHKLEIIQWMTSKISSDLRLIKPDKIQLRNLYRCEKALQDIHHLCESFQPEDIPRFESIAFTLFEHIDRIETEGRMHSSVKTDYLDHPKHTKNVRVFWFVLGCALSLTALYLYSIEMMKNCNIAEGYKCMVTISNDERLMHLTKQSISKMPLEEKALIEKTFVEAMENNVKTTIYQQYLNIVSVENKARLLFPNSLEVKRVSQIMEEQELSYQQELERDQERFDSARTMAANLVNIAKTAEYKQNIGRLEQYILSLSPIYSRNAFIKDQINQQNYELAREELTVLQDRVSRIVWQLSYYQSALSDVTDKDNNNSLDGNITLPFDEKEQH